ncbi:MAG: SDR family oxidoreductase [Desulfovibrio sp.]|jgi:nucleoside-diphosphate-sugar epimerase|nr:SDR family oxidoreductase [Desulfovibrio sp.]
MYTVLGSSGFIGSQVLARLHHKNCNVYAPSREETIKLKNKRLGNIIYCIGVTSDFREKPRETFAAHITLLSRILARNFCTSVTYLSSTRVYKMREDTREETPLLVAPLDRDDVYAISKLAGESFLLTSGIPAKIIRLSNVYSPIAPDFASGNFLDSVMYSAALYGKVTFQTTSASAKDFIHLADAVDLLFSIAESSKTGIFNLASGRNTSNATLGRALSACGVFVEFTATVKEWRFPRIRIEKLAEAFGRPKHNLIADVPVLLEKYRQYIRDVDKKRVYHG